MYQSELTSLYIPSLCSSCVHGFFKYTLPVKTVADDTEEIMSLGTRAIRGERCQVERVRSDREATLRTDREVQANVGVLTPLARSHSQPLTDRSSSDTSAAVSVSRTSYTLPFLLTFSTLWRAD